MLKRWDYVQTRCISSWSMTEMLGQSIANPPFVHAIAVAKDAVQAAVALGDGSIFLLPLVAGGGKPSFLSEGHTFSASAWYRNVPAASIEARA